MRIVVAQTSFLGDVVLSTPVFAALKHRWPHCHVTAWVRPEGAAVLAEHPHVDAILTDDKRGADAGLGGLVRVYQRLHAGRFDVAVAVHKSLRTAVLLAAARVPRRVGFRQSAGWFLYHERVMRDATRHDVERNLSIVSALGIDPEVGPARLLVVPSAAADTRAVALLRARGGDPSAPLIGLAPGSVWATKRWTVAGYAALATALHQRGYVVVLLGAPNERDIAAQVSRAAGGAAIDLVGQTDIAMLVAVVNRCRLLICNDSAPMHIAVARDVPVVVVFGPTHPSMGYGPYTTRAAIVQREDLSCRPCSRHGTPECPIGTHECMRGISAATVLAAAEPLLAQARESPLEVATP
jgi:heptosyltransferase-2